MTMQQAFTQAGFQPSTQPKAKWPRKRFNRTVGIRRELPTRKIVGKVN